MFLIGHNEKIQIYFRVGCQLYTNHVISLPALTSATKTNGCPRHNTTLSSWRGAVMMGAHGGLICPLENKKMMYSFFIQHTILVSFGTSLTRLGQNGIRTLELSSIEMSSTNARAAHRWNSARTPRPRPACCCVWSGAGCPCPGTRTPATWAGCCAGASGRI